MTKFKDSKSVKICKVEGCDNPFRCKGYCNKHYLQIRKHGKILNQTKYDSNRYVVSDSICKMSLNDTNGNIIDYAIIDKDDIDKVEHLKWGIGWAGYVTATKPNGKKVQIHRIIIGTKRGMDIDHINGDRLDNRKSNLRFATRSQNAANSPERKTNTSGFKGVCPIHEKWVAQINCLGNHYHLGYFDNRVDAAKAYNSAAREYFGEFAYQNPI